jgi:hypothetical protein
VDLIYTPATALSAKMCTAALMLSVEDLVAVLYKTKADFNAARPGKHLSAWWYKKLSGVLSETGFKNVVQSSAGKGSKVFNGFDRTFPEISLYVEATK